MNGMDTVCKSDCVCVSEWVCKPYNMHDDDGTMIYIWAIAKEYELRLR